MAQYDLTSAISQHLDPHLVLPLLEFLESKKVYPSEQILQGKLQVLEKTKMVDFASDVFKQLKPKDDIPKEYKAKREAVLNERAELHKACDELVDILGNTELVQRLKRDKDFHMAYLKENFSVNEAQLDALLTYARFLFECGQYSVSLVLLNHFRALSTENKHLSSAVWGQLGCCILLQRWDEALKHLNKLKDLIEAKSTVAPVQKLNQRTWLIHWSLFVFFNHPEGHSLLVDLYFQDKYMQAIQSTCPHVLRYLASAVITSSRRRQVLRDLVRVLEHSHDEPPVAAVVEKSDDDKPKVSLTVNSTDATDPVSAFVRRLYVQLDFEAAHRELAKCDELLSGDFFLLAQRDEFVENARLFVFETYCRIHQTIDIKLLAEKLNMDAEAAERWIVNMIRDARLDAKIDSANGYIVMGGRSMTPYQRVIEKTKALTLRSQVLVNNIGEIKKNPKKIKQNK